MKALLTKTQELNQEHHATLIGERKFGSTWGKELSAEDIAAASWREVPSDGPGMLSFCRYFKLDADGLAAMAPGARQRMELFCDLNPGDVLVKVAEHQDKATGRVHEMLSRAVRERGCTEAWLIVGPAENEDGNAIEGEQMIWTLFPGELAAPLPNDWDGSLSDTRITHCAVKGMPADEAVKEA